MYVGASYYMSNILIKALCTNSLKLRRESPTNSKLILQHVTKTSRQSVQGWAQKIPIKFPNFQIREAQIRSKEEQQSILSLSEEGENRRPQFPARCTQRPSDCYTDLLRDKKMPSRQEQVAAASCRFYLTSEPNFAEELTAGCMSVRKWIINWEREKERTKIWR